MSAQKVLGTDRPVETRIQRDVGIKEATIIEVEGCYSDLEREDPSTYCPNGLCVETSSLTSTGDGMGKLTIRCIAYDDGGSGSSFSPVRTTFRVDMQEVQYDLEDHPALEGVRGIVKMWLATDESERIDGSDYKYRDKSGGLVTVSGRYAIKFCNAYMAGIKTYNRYYPVIEKIGIWKNPPGLNRNGISFSGGEPTFSSNIGGFDTPPLTLSGFGASHFFKSKDSWSENADKTWSRIEQWTYTPEGSNGAHAWIYNTIA